MDTCKKDKQTILLSPRRARFKSCNLSRSASSSSSCDGAKMETASSEGAPCSDIDYDVGSEFGEYDSMHDLGKRLPQIRREMAHLLNLKDPELLNGRIDMTNVSEGTVLCKEGDFVRRIYRSFRRAPMLLTFIF